MLRYVPLAASTLIVTAALFLLPGCYTLKQGAVYLGYLGRAVPLDSLAKDDDGDGAAAEFAERVRGIRRFAIEELGLKDSKNYTTYVTLDRPYLAAIVSACAADSFTTHEWHYPVVGTMPYKGFFDPADARKEKARLEKKGLDVWVRGVDAFSTLGWFRDPLFSFMKDYSDAALADLIIHELTHAAVFVKGQVQFNEELAEFVGGEGARLYVLKKYGAASEEYQAINAGNSDRDAFAAFIRELCAELETVYASDLSREEKLERKAAVIAAAKKRFDAEYDVRFSGGGYRSFSKLDVNNAYLDLYRLYYGAAADTDTESGGRSIGSLCAAYGMSLPRFIAAAAALNGSRAARKDPRAALEAALAAAEPAAATTSSFR